jgi:hypothetical protein
LPTAFDDPRQQVVYELAFSLGTTSRGFDGAFPSCKGSPGGAIGCSGAFRIDEVKPSDVVAVHDLSGWSPEDLSDSLWRPNPDRVEASRKNPDQWLAIIREAKEKSPASSSA